MKKILITAVLAIGMIVTLQAQNELNKNAQAVKKYAPLRYELIKEFAEKDLKEDQTMMVDLINKQSDAFIEFLLASNNSDYDDAIMEKTMVNWTKISKKGYTIRDYQMIMYEYNQQLEAKKQY